MTSSAGVVCGPDGGRPESWDDRMGHPVVQGSAVFIPGNAWHSMRNTGPSSLRLYYVLQADGMGDVEFDFGDS